MLLGIVSPENTESTRAVLTTTLPAIIKYYLPMKTKSLNQTSIKIAIGDKVAVNMIIGINIIKAAKWSLDLEDEVIDAGIFRTELFKVYFKLTKQMVLHFGHDDSETKVLTTKQMVVTNVVDQCINKVFNTST
eukprot:1222565-Ditylum_brightwellii.AAC.1